MREFHMVTGLVRIGCERTARERGFDSAEQMAKAFEAGVALAARGTNLTLYILGGLFDPQTPEDVAWRYLERLQCRLILVLHEKHAAEYEHRMPWHEVVYTKELTLWGRKIGLSFSPAPVGEASGLELSVHGDETFEDDGKHVCAAWDAWRTEPGEFAAQNLYALSVYADQVGAGVAALVP